MINLQEFISMSKYQQLSQATQKAILNFDHILEGLGYVYEGIWRNDSPVVGTFKVPLECRLEIRENLITLRPKAEKLVVEVYWSQNNKLYFDVTENSTQEEMIDLLGEIHKLAKKYYKF